MSCQCKTEKQKARCVWWIGPEMGLVETNSDTGEVRVTAGCFPHLMMRWMTGVVKTNTSCASAMESARNHFAGAVTQLFALSSGQIYEPPRLEHEGDDAV